MYVYPASSIVGPVDIIAITKEGKLYLFDAKKDARRHVPERGKKHRIHRILTPFQKILGVRIAYVDVKTREVHIVPPLDKK